MRRVEHSRDLDEETGDGGVHDGETGVDADVDVVHVHLTHHSLKLLC